MVPVSVLLVEDNEDILANLYAYLEPLGYELDCARNGRTGLEMAASGQFDLVVLDIRTPEEFRDGHLPGARNLDFFAPDFRQRLEALAREDVPILLYCRSGNRSGQAMRLLRQWGRDDVLHLADGFRAWRAADLPEE